MNKKRRERIAAAVGMIETALGILEEVENEEQEAYDNMPDALRDGDKGSAMSEAVDTISNARQEIEGGKDSLADLANDA